MTDTFNPARSFQDSKFEDLDDGASAGSIRRALDCLESSILIVDDELRILHANASAGVMLGLGPGETSLLPYIVGEARAQSLAMRRRIKDAIANQRPAMIALSHAGHGRLICSVKSIPPFGTARPCALICLTPEDQSPADVSGYLCDVYKLSRAEAEIATSAATGAEVAQIMLDRKVPIHTLRAQIASIKAKMGMSRMTEVAAAIARIQAAVAI